MKKFLTTLLSLFLINAAFAQIENPVKWNFTSKTEGDEIILSFNATIEGDWHLYDVYLEEGGPISTSFNYENENSFEKVGKIKSSPAPTKSYDEAFEMDLRYFKKQVTFTQRIKIKDASIKNIKGYVEYMVCNDGSCLPPTEADFNFKVELQKKTEPTKENITPVNAQADKEIEQTAVEADQTIKNEQAETEPELITCDDPEQTITVVETNIADSKESKKEEALWYFFFFSFLAGLAAILTPCVFPMIPMTVSFFMHSGKSKTQGRLHAMFYGLSIVAIYTIIGSVVAVVFGPGIANWLSTHWIPNIIFFTVFVVFAFSFFGMFEITLPSWIVNKSDANADKGGLFGAFFMALTLVLVSFSCTGPIVGAILVQSAGGDVIKPIIGMLGFSLAFALPFTLFAIFPSWLSNLPKSGGWLNSVKVVLGFLELALGLKFLSIADQTYHWGILDREVYLALWIVIFALLGLYLLGKIKFAHDSDIKFLSVPRLMLSIITFGFVIYMIPGMFGAPLKALSGYMPPMATHDFDLNKIVRDEIKLSGGISSTQNNAHTETVKYADFLHLPHGLEGFFDYEQGMAYAKKQGRPVFIDFTGHGCVNCREMEANVWSHPDVLKRLRNDFVIIALYVDDKKELPENEWITSTYDGKVKKTIGKKNADFQITRFGVNAQPYYVLMDNEGNSLVEPKAYDLDPTNFIKFLDQGIEAYKK